MVVLNDEIGHLEIPIFMIYGSFYRVISAEEFIKKQRSKENLRKLDIGHNPMLESSNEICL
jgi:hypothetical protein